MQENIGTHLYHDGSKRMVLLLDWDNTCSLDWAVETSPS